MNLFKASATRRIAQFCLLALRILTVKALY
jgi:hypothetical protein